MTIMKVQVVTFYDIEMMHCKWLGDDATDKIEKYKPKYVGFQRSLRSLRMRTFDGVEWKVFILLDISVQHHILYEYDLVHNSRL